MIGVRFPTGGGIFLCECSVQTSSGAHPPNLSIRYQEHVARGINRPQREAGHSSPYSDGVKIEWNYIYTYSWPTAQDRDIFISLDTYRFPLACSCLPGTENTNKLSFGDSITHYFQISLSEPVKQGIILRTKGQ
jgi:hypothetical protein